MKGICSYLRIAATYAAAMASLAETAESRGVVRVAGARGGAGDPKCSACVPAWSCRRGAVLEVPA